MSIVTSRIVSTTSRSSQGFLGISLAFLVLASAIGDVCSSLSASPSTSTTSFDDGGLFERGYRALYRVYEECEQRNVAVSPCLKRKAIAFFDRLGRIENLSIAENLELVKAAPSNDESSASSSASPDLESNLGRTSGATKDEMLNDILLERVATLLNSFNVQIRLPKTNTAELKRSIEEGRGKMKKMMGMMMMGMAMKMAALVPIAMGVLFLLAGKALIISKIALVLSLIIGLKKLLAQKQGHDSHGGWQQGGGGGGGGWDRSFKQDALAGSFKAAASMTDADRQYAHNLAYGGRLRR